MQQPRRPHFDSALHYLRYLISTPSLGLFMNSASSLHLFAFCYSNWGSCNDSRRSSSEYFFQFGWIYYFLEIQETTFNLPIISWSKISVNAVCCCRNYLASSPTLRFICHPFAFDLSSFQYQSRYPYHKKSSISWADEACWLGLSLRPSTIPCRTYLSLSIFLSSSQLADIFTKLLSSP